MKKYSLNARAAGRSLKELPFEGTISNAILREKLKRMFIAGYKAAKADAKKAVKP